MKRVPTLLSLASMLLTSAAVAASEPAPQPVSPGSTEGTRLIAERCPTFNWAGDAGAETYELLVYRVSAAEETEERPLVHEFLPGGSNGWTPSLDLCLEAGGSYAWMLRSATAGRTSEWSRPSLFAIAGGFAAPLAAGRAGVAAPPAPAAASHLPGRGVSRARVSAPTAVPLLTPDAAGIRAAAPGTSGATFGVYGISESSGDGSAGIVGESTATSGETAGVAGLVHSSVGVALVGENTATSGFAVGLEARTNSAGGVAATFNNTAGGKILSAAVGASEKFSVDGSGNLNFEGTLSGTGTGQSSVNGNFSVGGTLTKTMGSFRIDHPLDPANKYLYHSFVESPDMKDIYDGVVTLGADGAARVELPDWFEALNFGYRYQLTALGEPMPSLHVAEEIAGNSFAIAGGPPGGRVCWQVTGIRQDAYARAHRIRVEEDKPAYARGTYLHPELFERQVPGGDRLADSSTAAEAAAEGRR